MLYTYREVVGCHAFKNISTETQIPVTSLTQYILYGHTPNYDTGRRLGLFLQEEFQNMPRDVIIVFDEKYPHIK